MKLRGQHKGRGRTGINNIWHQSSSSCNCDNCYKWKVHGLLRASHRGIGLVQGNQWRLSWERDRAGVWKMRTRYLLGDRVNEEHCTVCTLWWEKSVTLGGTGGPVWLEHEEPGRVGWNEMGEAEREGNLWRLVGSVRSGVFFPHQQMSCEGFKQTSSTIRFVFQRVTLMTTRRAD